MASRITIKPAVFGSFWGFFGENNKVPIKGNEQILELLNKYVCELSEGEYFRMILWEEDSYRYICVNSLMMYRQQDKYENIDTMSKQDKEAIRNTTLLLLYSSNNKDPSLDRLDDLSLMKKLVGDKHKWIECNVTSFVDVRNKSRKLTIADDETCVIGHTMLFYKKLDIDTELTEGILRIHLD